MKHAMFVGGLFLAVTMLIVSQSHAAKLYWSDAETGSIRELDLDSMHQDELVAGLNQPRNLALDTVHRVLYWTEATGGGLISKATIGDANASAVLMAPMSSIEGLAVDGSRDRIYWADNAFEHIRNSSLNGDSPATLIPGFDSLDGVGVDVSTGRIFFVDNAALWSADSDGSGLDMLVDFTLDHSAGRRVAVDSTAGQVYWTDPLGNRIRRANLDGTNVEDVIGGTSGNGNPLLPYGIAVDPIGGKLYWTEWGSQDSPPLSTAKIAAANLDGTSIDELIVTGLTAPDSLVFDAVPEPNANLQITMMAAAWLFLGSASRILRRRLRRAASC